jgi:uncharacterized protein YbjT (DUF2867 family)
MILKYAALFFVTWMLQITNGVKVVVTGAAGRTGSFIFQKLLKLNDYDVVGLVRSQNSAAKLVNMGAKQENIAIGDIRNIEQLNSAFSGAEKVILCTSAVPKIKLLSILKTLIFKVIGQSARPEFTFPENSDPYNVDWLGAKNQIDAAKKAGVKQFVFLSSMGGTQKDNFLNTIGKVEGEENSGNILLWKRKAEEYLIASGIPYTIIHPGGLLDKAGGQREIVFGLDDNLLKEKVRSIPREDVAEICVQALKHQNAKNRSFDVISQQPGQGLPTTDWKEFFNNKGTNTY